MTYTKVNSYWSIYARNIIIMKCHPTGTRIAISSISSVRISRKNPSVHKTEIQKQAGQQIMSSLWKFMSFHKINTCFHKLFYKSLPFKRLEYTLEYTLNGTTVWNTHWMALQPDVLSESFHFYLLVCGEGHTLLSQKTDNCFKGQSWRFRLLNRKTSLEGTCNYGNESVPSRAIGKWL